MTAAGKVIEEQIRALPLEDMLTIHERLVRSIHSKEEREGLEPSFRDEIRRRIEEIESGKAEGADAFEVIKNL